MNFSKFGTVLIIIGFAAFFIGTLFSAQKVNIGGLIMIGPVPIAFGTSPEITIIAMILGILLMLLFFVIKRRNEKIEEKGIPAKDITEGSRIKVNGGGVIFIGPIPVVFGSDKRYAIIAILLAIVLMLLAIAFREIH
ncbi:MAG: DUF131 domain-containing protein [Candidatus Methanoperedens sp.]|nr:DUF131 domain-containing protein [Candidatus Methanoperedens sp.]